MAKVSIILPTYNGAKYIRQAINSIIIQVYQDWELIIVDDGSKDQTPDILNEFTDNRIRIIRHQENRKLPSALNSGFHASQGELITWTSDDNVLSPYFLTIFVNFADNHPDIDFVYSDYMLIDENGNEKHWFRTLPLESIKFENIGSASFLFRRNVFKFLGGFNEKTFLAEDYEFFLRVYTHFKIFYLKTETPIYFYREHGSSLTSKFRWESHALAVRLRRQILKINYYEYKKQLAFVHVQAAYDANRNSNFKEVRLRFLRAIVCNPFWLLNRGFISIMFRSFLPRDGKGING
jgi:glycosyltransferase involved in cell wall biosynthesis